MGNISSWPAPAKINLFLHINGRREDGYHELQTVFIILDHGDNLTFTEVLDNTITILPNLGFPQEENIVYKAAMLLREQTKCQKGITIKVNKQIPMGGGLGGGSSDAATTLIALNEIWQLGLTIDTLAMLGRKLGADVPVFVKGNSSFAEGVGEKLTAYNIAENYYLVVTPKNTNISTKKIFTHKDLQRNTPKLDIKDISFSTTHNDCEILVKKYYPEVAKSLLWLLKYAPSRMTGTGASCFAEFSDKNLALKALSEMPNSLNGFVAKACNISPLYEALQEFRNKSQA
jgi:4-diphosphocytidyl-2-C-methyl-D-erythritol kinase